MEARLESIVDQTTLARYFMEWKSLGQEEGTKTSRGEIIQEVCRRFGIESESTVYKYFNRLGRGQSVFEATERKPRGGVVLTSRRKQQAALVRQIAILKVATETQSKTKYASTSAAMRIGVEEGLFRAEDLPHRTTIDRMLGKLGLRARDFKKPHTAVQLYADFAGEWLVVDATPLDQHFLRLDNKFQYKKGLSEKDKHLADLLKREGLRRIWLFFAVDLYSGAWFCRAYAPEGGGEDTATWIDFLTDYFLSKDSIPLQSVPLNIYCDRGSGMSSNEMRTFLDRLGISVTTHLPGNPSAKGMVEGRISGSKRSHETLLKGLEDDYLDLVSLNEHYKQWQIFHNTQSGAYMRFCESTNSKPLHSVNADDIRNARFAFHKRKVDAYGVISIKWGAKAKVEKFFVARDLPKGLELHVFRDVTGKVKALDPRTGRMYDCDPRGKQRRKMGTFHNDIDYDWNDTEAEQLRKEVRREAKGTSFAFQSTLPPKIDIPEWKGKTIQHFVPDPSFATVYESVGDALCVLEEIAGEIEEDLLPAIVASFKSILEANGKIVLNDLRKYIEILQGGE
ncbi:integrase core domain protein [Leptospira interrogans str. 2003000735]|uniref:Integrase core domain protein n=1 Tax=Leptospira interrogans str. 2002000626 TaxID=996803 RepID=A0A829D2Q4_LEPIR|nr:DDE-type integrase/transposase/recombinase [Leptospira interrogans]EMY05353.1 integrase core domain protein [Leptospira interrogans str. 2002000626]EKN89023.1 integrase core domain protein [Leptospira interrogans str. 2002000624]EKQ36330.1 integrase core domain protein [Leptospira interrogans str. 2002000621]EKQ47580.1 integrase core domain protein [Leptospira interrogans str. 2002000623]EMJ67065.1 integrase core domain protein [Leptospira interrogans str. 2003000735]